MLDLIRHFFAWTARPLIERNKGNLRLILGCFLVSSLIWIFNALNRNHEATLRVPLEVRFNDAKYVPLHPLPKHALATVEGYGWHILRTTSFEKHHKIILWVKHPGLHSRIDTSVFREYLEQHLTEDLLVKHVKIDSLEIPFDLKAHKWLHMKLDEENISFESGYVQDSPVSFEPDSIHITGPKSVISQITDTLLVHVPYKDLDKDFDEKIRLDYFFHNPSLQLGHEKVEVKFQVSKKTKSTWRIGP